MISIFDISVPQSLVKKHFFTVTGKKKNVQSLVGKKNVQPLVKKFFFITINGKRNVFF